MTAPPQGEGTPQRAGSPLDMTGNASPPGAEVVMVALAEVLTSAELMWRTLGGDPHGAISVPVSSSQLPLELALVARAAWAVAVGHDGAGPGALAVIRALTCALTVAELLRRNGSHPRVAIAISLRLDDLPRGLSSVLRDAWAFAVGLEEDGSSQAPL